MNKTGASTARLREILSDAGALDVIVYSSIDLSRYVSECEMSTDLLVAEAVLEFGEEWRIAREAVSRSRVG